MTSIGEYADKIMTAIDSEIKAGFVPATVASFSELHDYSDANEYLTEAGYLWENTDESRAFVNAVEGEVDRRLRERAPLCEGCYEPLNGAPSPCDECARNAW